MLRVALVLRSTDVRPDFLVLHVLLVHIVEYMSFVGNITPGPYWWWCTRIELCIAGADTLSMQTVVVRRQHMLRRAPV